jgi:hypothetical protein
MTTLTMRLAEEWLDQTTDGGPSIVALNVRAFAVWLDLKRPDATPLDVERLALALHNTGLNSIGHKPGFHGRYSDHCICHPDAAQIANEYAAITPKDFSTRIYKENRGE